MQLGIVIMELVLRIIFGLTAGVILAAFLRGDLSNFTNPLSKNLPHVVTSKNVKIFHIDMINRCKKEFLISRRVSSETYNIEISDLVDVWIATISFLGKSDTGIDLEDKAICPIKLLDVFDNSNALTIAGGKVRSFGSQQLIQFNR
jgi:hypothetical protein